MSWTRTQAGNDPRTAPTLDFLDREGRAAVAARRRRLALRAVAWLRQNLSNPPTIAKLCAAVGTRERTLHEAFREHLDASPMAYLKALRLKAARQDLLTAWNKRVTDVALDWGFNHFGWFSQDYRRRYGETPRQTLARRRARRGRASVAARRSRLTQRAGRARAA